MNFEFTLDFFCKFQYCEYYPDYESCKKWLEEHLPEKFSEMSVATEAGETDEDAKKRQKRGGKGVNNLIFPNTLISRNFFNNYQGQNYLNN